MLDTTGSGWKVPAVPPAPLSQPPTSTTAIGCASSAGTRPRGRGALGKADGRGASLLGIPAALLDDIVSKTVQLGAGSALSLTCRALSMANLLIDREVEAQPEPSQAQKNKKASGWFTRVRVLPDGQEAFEEIAAKGAVIPNVADRNMFLQLCRGLPPPGRQSRPSEAVEDVLAFHPGLHARLNAAPRYEHDHNTVDDVGTKLETNFANSLTE
ncbi:hypothetical protein HaLaN_09888, partial [Haematococcus lacustris]